MTASRPRWCGAARSKAAPSSSNSIKVVRDSDVRVLRDNVVIYQSKIGSLRRFKDDVKEVASGYECGATVANFSDIKVGDVLEVFKTDYVLVAEPGAYALSGSDATLSTAKKTS